MRSQECVELLKWATERFDKRRSYEWKITLGFWAAIMAIAYKGVFVPLSAWAVALAFFSAFWVRGVRVANENDKLLIDYYRELLRNGTYRQITVPAEPPKIERSQRKWWSSAFDWNGCFQMGATAGIMVLAYVATLPAILPEDQLLPYHYQADCEYALSIVIVVAALWGIAWCISWCISWCFQKFR